MPKISAKSRELLKCRWWLNPNGVTTQLSSWVWKLLPFDLSLRHVSLEWQAQFGETLTPTQFFRYCAIVGSMEEGKVRIGQVSLDDRDGPILILHFRTLREAQLLQNFGSICCMSKPASILRTTIMLGLSLPKVELGVMSPTRTKLLNVDEITQIKDKALEILNDRGNSEGSLRLRASSSPTNAGHSTRNGEQYQDTSKRITRSARCGTTSVLQGHSNAVTPEKCY